MLKLCRLNNSHSFCLVWMKFLLYWQWQHAMSCASGTETDWRCVVDRFCEETRQESESAASWEKQGNVSNLEFNFSVSLHTPCLLTNRRSRFGHRPNPSLGGILLSSLCAFSQDAPVWRPAISPRQNVQRRTSGSLDTVSVVAEFNFFLISSIVWRTSRAWTLASCCVSVFSASLD